VETYAAQTTTSMLSVREHTLLIHWVATNS